MCVCWVDAVVGGCGCGCVDVCADELCVNVAYPSTNMALVNPPVDRSVCSSA